MKTTAFVLTGLLVSALIAPALVETTPPNEDGFTLLEAVPNDVFLCIAEKNNPKKAFIEHYWEEVFKALEESGIHNDVIELFGHLLGALDDNQAAEVKRLKDRVLKLVAGVDWADLAGQEFVFAEKFIPPQPVIRDMILQPSLVWMFRGSSEGAAKNFQGLTAMLDAMVEEINNVAGAGTLIVDRSTRMGAEVASINLLKRVTQKQSMPISIALRNDKVIIGLREHLFEDVLDLMDGNSKKKALAQDPRFRAAFAKLPPAEDLVTFFDMQPLLKSVRITADLLINKITGVSDCYENSGIPPEVNGLYGKAMSAYKSGDIQQALALTKEAYEVAPDNSIILYNLACFNALAGNQDEAIAWLERAVDGGFYAPVKIAGDSDLTSLHGKPKYRAMLTKAADLAMKYNAKDTVINYANEGEVFRLRMQVNQTYETQDYEQGLKLCKQAYTLDPTDSKVVYTLACLHTLLGHEAEGFDFLEKAVEGGFYCPKHMCKDPDLESVRDHERFKAAVTRAEELAGMMAVHKQKETTTMAKRIIDRLLNAVGVLDYSAAIHTTDGYATTTETIVQLVPDAKERPIYNLFGKRPQLTGFDKYLPKETTSFSVSGGLDLGALYGFVEDTIRLMGPPGEEALAKWKGIQKQIGFDLHKDVIDWFDGDAVSVTLADGGSVFMMKVKNEETAREKVNAAIEFGTTNLSKAVAENPALMGLAMMGLRTSEVDHDQLEGFKGLHFAMAPQPLVWGVADGHLIFGSPADAIALCLATARGDHPNIRSNTRAMGEAIVPDGPFTSVSLTDRRGMGEEIAEGLGIATMVTGMMGSFIPEPEARPILAKISGMLGKLAPVARKINFYKSAAATTTFDGERWHSRGVTHYFSPAERAVKDTSE